MSYISQKVAEREKELSGGKTTSAPAAGGTSYISKKAAERATSPAGAVWQQATGARDTQQKADFLTGARVSGAIDDKQYNMLSMYSGAAAKPGKINVPDSSPKIGNAAAYATAVSGGTPYKLPETQNEAIQMAANQMLKDTSARVTEYRQQWEADYARQKQEMQARAQSAQTELVKRFGMARIADNAEREFAFIQKYMETGNADTAYAYVLSRNSKQVKEDREKYAAAAEKGMDALTDYAAMMEENTPGFLERTWDTTKSAAKAAWAGFMNLAGYYAQGQQMAATAKSMPGLALMGGTETAKNYFTAANALAELSQEATHKEAARLYVSSQQDMMNALENAGAGDELWVKGYRAALDLLTDMAVNYAVPGSGLVNMGARVFSESLIGAQVEGYNNSDALIIAAKDAAIEVLTEKIGGPFNKIYGKTALSKFTARVAKNFEKNTLGSVIFKIAAGAGEEAAEEFIGGVANEFATRFLGYDDGIGKVITPEEWGDIFSDALIGGVLGAFGGGVEATANYGSIVNTVANAAIDNAYSIAAQKGLFSEEAYKALADAKQKTAKNGEVYAEEDDDISPADISEENADENISEADNYEELALGAMTYEEQEDFLRERYADAIKDGIMDEGTVGRMSAELREGTPLEDMVKRADAYVRSEKTFAAQELELKERYAEEIRDGIMTDDDIGTMMLSIRGGMSPEEVINQMDEIVADIRSDMGKETDNGEQSNGGSLGRQSDVGTAEQSGRVPEGAGRNQSEERGDDTRREETRRNDGKKPAREKVSGRELRIPDGTDNKTMTVIKPKGVTARIVKAFAPATKSITLVSGVIEQKRGDEDAVSVSGLETADGRIFARTDHRLYSGDKLLLHECGHLYLRDDAELRRKMHNAAVDALDAYKVELLTNHYSQLWRGLYPLPDGVESYDELTDYFETDPAEYEKFIDTYEEELFCDALAGLDRVKAPGASKLTDALRAVFKEETGIDIDAILNGTVEGDTETVEAKGTAADVEERETGPPKFSVDELDAEYEDAIFNNDMERAQELVDEAARAAGYDYVDLYHGTGAFGFTKFDMSKMDDGISIFTTDNEHVAKTYSGGIGTRRIGKRSITPEYVNAADENELLTLMREYINADIEIISESEKETILKDTVDRMKSALKTATEFYEDNQYAFDDEKQEKFNVVLDTITEMLQTPQTLNYDAFEKYNDAMWELKWLDDSLATELSRKINSDIQRAWSEIGNLSELRYKGDISRYMRQSEAPYFHKYDAVDALSKELFAGTYRLAGTMSRPFEIDARGANWDKIPGELIGAAPGSHVKTRDVSEYAKKNRHDGVIIRNLVDNGDFTYSGASNVHIFFDPKQVKSADPITYDDDGNVIPLSERFKADNEDIRYSADEELSADVLLNESNEEIAERLSIGKMKVTTAKEEVKESFDYNKLLHIGTTDAKKYLMPIFKKIGIFKKYSNDSLQVEFEYSSNGARRSMAHQSNQTPGSFDDFALVHANLEEICRNAYPLEMHYDEKPKGDYTSITGVATFGSILRTETGDMPIKLTVKFFRDNNAKLHVIINNKNRGNFVKEARPQIDEVKATESAPIEVRVADFINFVKHDEEFTKRIPLELILGEDTRFSADEDDTVTEEEVKRQKDVKRRASSMGLRNLREKVAALDGQIAGYETAANRTEKQEEKLRQLITDRDIYGKALGKKEKKAEKRKAEREKAKQTAEEKANSLPLRLTTRQSRANLRQQIYELYGIKQGRSEVAAAIDAFIDTWIEQGKIGYAAIEKLENILADMGEFTVESFDESAREFRSFMHGNRISVSEGVIEEFGDDWKYIRQRAFAAKIYLTRNGSDSSIDQWTQELANSFGAGMFDENADEKTQLERIISLAEDGAEEKLSVAQMAEYVRKTNGKGAEDEYIESIHEQLMHALKSFAQSAKVEMSTVKSSVYREVRRNEELKERMERAQKEKEQREFQQKTLKQLQWLKRNQNFMGNNFQEEAKRILADIDTIAVSAANEMNWSDKHQATWKDLAAMYKWAEKNDPNFLPSRELENIVMRVEGKHLDELSASDLEEIYKAAVALRTAYYNRNNVIGDELHRQFTEVFEASVYDMKSAPKPKKKTGKGRNYLDQQLNPIHRIERMFGWKENSPGFQIFGRGLEKGERMTKRYVEQANQMLDDWMTENGEWVRNSDGQGKDATWYELEVPELLEFRMGDKPIFGKPVKVYMTPMQKVYMYLESKNYDNLRHMAGGRTFADKELYSQGEYTEAFAQGTTVSLAPETVRKIVSDLTPQEMELAQLLDKYFNGYAKTEINRVSNILYGYDRAMNDNYAPIFTNSNYNKSEPGIYQDGTAEGVGHMKTRAQGAKNPTYNISALQAFNKHVSQTSRFVGMAIPAQNAKTLLNWSAHGVTMQDHITHEWSQKELDSLTNVMTELQAPTYMEQSEFAGALGKIMSNYIGGVFGANITVAAKVLASKPTAAIVLGNDNYPSIAQQRAVNDELVRKYTSELDVRIRGLGRPELAALTLDEGKYQKWVQSHKGTQLILGGGLLQAADVYVARTMWAWAENKVRAEYPELEVGTQEQIDAGMSPFYRKVAEVYDNAIGDTQSMYDIMHRSDIMRDTNELTRSFTIFHTDSLQAANLLRKRAGELQAAKAKGNEVRINTAKKAAAVAVGNVLLMNALVVMFDILRDLWRKRDDEYENDEGDITFWSFTAEALQQLAESTSGLLIGLDAILPAIESIFTGDTYFEHQIIAIDAFNDILNGGRDFGKSLKSFIEGFADVISNDGDAWQYLTEAADFRGAVKDAAKNIVHYFSGIPVNNVERLITNVLGRVWPQMAAAYDGIWDSGSKADLKKSSAISADIMQLYSGRGDIDRDTANELARLYEAGFTDAVISDTPADFSVNGEKVILTEADKQRYNAEVAKNLDGELNGLIESPEYQGATDEQKAKMLSKLYTYAAEQAKSEIDPGYDKSNWVEAVPDLRDAGANWGQITEALVKQSELNKTSMTAGEKATEFAIWADNKGYTPRVKGAIKDAVSFFSMVPAEAKGYEDLTAAGVSSTKAEEINEVLNELTPQKGSTQVSTLQKVSAVSYMTISEADKEKAMKVIYSGNEKAYNRYMVARKHGVLSADYSDFLEELDRIDTNGSLTQSEFTEAVARTGFDTEAAKEIWYIYWPNARSCPW